MSKQDAQREQNVAILANLQRRHEQLLLQEKELEYQAELLANPVVQDKLLRDQKWLKKIGEENLKLLDFTYEKRQVILPTVAQNTPIQAWIGLLFQGYHLP